MALRLVHKYINVDNVSAVNTSKHAQTSPLPVHAPDLPSITRPLFVKTDSFAFFYDLLSIIKCNIDIYVLQYTG